MVLAPPCPMIYGVCGCPEHLTGMFQAHFEVLFFVSCILYHPSCEGKMINFGSLQGKDCTAAGAWLLDLVGVGISSKDCNKNRILF